MDVHNQLYFRAIIHAYALSYSFISFLLNVHLFTYQSRAHVYIRVNPDTEQFRIDSKSAYNCEFYPLLMEYKAVK